MRVNVGDVIWAPYLDFQGEIKNAMFVVCYHECNDISTSTNFTAIKISSNPACYQILLQKQYLPFLAHDSYLNCNMQFRFREDQVVSIAGRLNSYYISKMNQQISHYYDAMSNQQLKFLNN